MKIKLNNYKQVGSKKIDSVEKELDTTLPRDYIHFIKKYDGAIPEENFFDKELLLGVTRFIPVGSIHDLIRGIEKLPEQAIVFAEGHGGEYLYIDKSSKKIFFWDHELEDDKEIATDFTSFLKMLKPLDLSTLNLEPPKVLGGWVDPNFKPVFD